MNKSDTKSPCNGQSEKSIKKWLHSNVAVGTQVGIRRIENGTLQYQRAIVLSMRPKNFNVGVQQKDGTFAQSGEPFDYSGKNWGDPKGPTRLVVLTEAVLAACDTCAWGEAFLPGTAQDYSYSVRAE